MELVLEGHRTSYFKDLVSILVRDRRDLIILLSPRDNVQPIIKLSVCFAEDCSLRNIIYDHKPCQ